MSTPTVSVSPTVAKGLRSPLGGGLPIRAVLFDLDGTLYDQPRMRLLMALELLVGLVLSPWNALRKLRGLREYRRAQEALRHTARSGSLGDAQLQLAAARAGMLAVELAPLVREWMEERPLKHIAGCSSAGLVPLLAFLSQNSVRVGVFSDYPAHAKLKALGIADSCSPILCASDPEIGVFKPDPRGFLVACERWGLSPPEVLMVGDRIEVDGAGAVAAGMPCVIIGSRSSSTLDRDDVLILDSLERLHGVLDDGR